MLFTTTADTMRKQIGMDEKSDPFVGGGQVWFRFSKIVSTGTGRRWWWGVDSIGGYKYAKQADGRRACSVERAREGACQKLAQTARQPSFRGIL